MASSVVKPPPFPPEGRSAQRKRVLLGGRIVYNDGGGTYDCAIRDLSAAGARLAIPGATVVPKRFYLLDLKNAVAYECEVIWRNATQTGVRFRGGLNLSDVADPKLKYLRNLYAEARMRGSD